MFRNLLVITMILAAAALVLSACGGGSYGSEHSGTAATHAANANDISVTARDFSFDNTNLSAKAGEPLHLAFKNAGRAEHSFTIPGVVETEAEGGDTANVDFTAPQQTVEFHCKYHPTQMKGTLTIGS